MLPLALIGIAAWQVVPPPSADLPAPREHWLPVLMRVSRMVREQTGRLGDFTCVQTVTRHTVDRKRREARDTLRFETGVVGEREVFGWPGQDLGHASPAELISFGASTTGDLYSAVRSAVGNREVTITEVKLTSAGEMIFHYEMGILRSGFTVGGPRGSAVVAFRGEFSVDPVESRLLSFRRLADDIPVEIGTRRTETILRFDRRANQPPFDIVPVSAVTVMDDWLGGTNTLASTWQGCAEFAVTSQISFGEEPAVDKPAPKPRMTSRWVEARSGTFSTELSGEYVLAKLTAGDLIELRLTTPVKLADHTIIPAETGLMARVVLNNERSQDHTRVVGLRLDTYVADGRRVLLNALAEQIAGAGVETNVRVIRSSTRTSTVGLTSSFESSSEKLYLDRTAGAATFMLPLSATKLPQPLTIKWRVE